MDEAFEPGPDFLQRRDFAAGLPAGVTKQRGGQHEQPAGNPGHQRELRPGGPARDGFQLGRPVGHLRDLRPRLIEKPFDPARQVQGGDAAEIAGEDRRRDARHRDQGAAAAEKKMPAAKDRAAARALRVEEKRVQPGRAEMLQHGLVDGQPFGGPRGGESVGHEIIVRQHHVPHLGGIPAVVPDETAKWPQRPGHRMFGSPCFIRSMNGTKSS